MCVCVRAYVRASKREMEMEVMDEWIVTMTVS